jgi:hypothetical protein
MLYFSFQKLEIYQLSKELVKDEQLYCINQKKQYLNNISTTFTTLFKQCFV